MFLEKKTEQQIVIIVLDGNMKYVYFDSGRDKVEGSSFLLKRGIVL